MSISYPSVKASPLQRKCASRSPGARVVREPTMKPTPALSRAFRLAAESMPASATMMRSSMPWAAWKASTMGMIVVVSARLPSQQPILRGKPARSTSSPTMIWGSTLLSLAVTDLAQLVLLLGLEVERGDVVETQ